MPQRQSVNIATDLSVLGNNNFNVNFNLRFAPDEVIVRAINYSDKGTADVDKFGCQIVTDIVDDQVIGLFSSGVTTFQSMGSHFHISRRGRLATANFQIQYAPSAAQGHIGNGDLVTPSVQGDLSFQLEFVKHDE